VSIRREEVMNIFLNFLKARQLHTESGYHQFFHSEISYDLENPINASVFPGHQGGPHNHTIAALAVALRLAKSPEFRDYQMQVLKNAKCLEENFRKAGFDMVSGGTDTHLLLLDLRKKVCSLIINFFRFCFDTMGIGH
jgi:glycine/serine hydroxymethyltransferase